jgi:mono/diheme cytochrome c family protein
MAYSSQTKILVAVLSPEMAASPSMIHPISPTKTISFQGKRLKKTVRTVAAGSCAVFCVALVCSLPQPAGRTVRAYSKGGKETGAVLFHEKGCEHCHGVNGRDGDLGPDLSTIGKRWNKKKIEHQIRDGGASMPAFGGALKPDEISDLVDFLHAERKAPKADTALSR